MSAGGPTKAEALACAAALLPSGTVPPFVYWTVADWRSERRAVVAACLARLGGVRLAVRSATRDEDAADGGLAGHFRSELDVTPTPDALARAVDRVVAAYPDDGRIHHVLVQEMVTDARRSGVVATRDPATGAPYDVVELAEGPATDLVTSGRAATTRVAVLHGAEPRAVAATGCAAIVAAARAAARAVFGDRGAEVELAERTGGAVAVLQVRPLPFRIAARAARDRHVARGIAHLAATVELLGRPRAGLAGASTVLGVMPDWNPAELIGVHPMPLAAGIFRALVTDRTWQQARAALGYQSVPRTPLVRMLAGRPYVDVRASFNSFLPAGLPFATRAALVDAWLARLRAAPELHDRVELEIAVTVRDFAAGAARGVLRADAAREWRRALAALTARAVDPGPRGSLATALRHDAGASVSRASTRPRGLRVCLTALGECRITGARPFAVVARHAFMAERLLRSLVERGALAPERLDAFRRSLTTVAGRFAADWSRAARGTLAPGRFVARWGHLRPGAFDVTSLPYGLRGRDLWTAAPEARPPRVAFVARAAERAAIDRLLREVGIGGDAAALLAWAAAAIVGREEAKLRFTRRLSAILEDLAAWGRACGLAREEIALLSLRDLRHAAAAARGDGGWLRARIDAASARRECERTLRLGPLVRDAADLVVVVEAAVLPTFVSERTVVAAPVALDGRGLDRHGLRGRLVCAERADPGFDWIFGCGIVGLVTRFGGGNSHMAVRCRELDVPAALGVGAPVFERVIAAATVELRCSEGVLRVVGAPAEDAPAPVTWCEL